jgi:hypothetical protein
MHITPDPVKIKFLERYKKRPLTEEERLGLKSVRIYKNGKYEYHKVEQVNLAALHAMGPRL